MKRILKEGYYLSAYVSIDSLGNVLETTLRHDQNIALWKYENSHLVLLAHWELERRTGVKHHNISFFSREDFEKFVNQLLEPYNLKYSDLEEVIGISEEKMGLSNIAYHSRCHLYAALLTETNLFYSHDIIALALDGGPDFIAEKIARKKFFYCGAFSHNGIVTEFPIASPGPFWAMVREFLGLPEGTLMALAGATKSHSYKKIKIDEIPLIYKYADMYKAQRFIKNLIQEINNYSEGDKGIKFNYFDDRFTEQENKIGMIMQLIQDISIRVVEKNLSQIINQFAIDTQKTFLALSGGFCLNCPCNTYIYNKFAFKKQILQPCINDTGQSIGMGLKYFYENSDRLSFEFPGAYLGDRSGIIDSELEKYIKKIEDTLEYFVDDIIASPIIWVEGAAESGPRALGHRSILADPRQKKSKDILNAIKKREWWRPVAPMVLKEEGEKWFEKYFDSPFMLNNFKILSEKSEIVPAILHLDGTARVQTVDSKQGLIYNALLNFYKKTNIPILCNTSLNDKGEPIINSINEAINFALRKKIHIIYHEGKRIELFNHDKYIEKLPLKREDSDFKKYKDLMRELNPQCLSKEDYYIYRTTPQLAKYDLKSEEEAKKVKRITAKANKIYNIMN